MNSSLPPRQPDTITSEKPDKAGLMNVMWWLMSIGAGIWADSIGAGLFVLGLVPIASAILEDFAKALRRK
jgi:hypothetical protein